MTSSQLEHALKAASEWYGLLASGQADEQDIKRWKAWCDDDPYHAQAWQRVEALKLQIAALPAHVNSEVLAPRAAERRRVLGQVAILCGVGLTSIWAYRVQPWRGYMADYVTSIGEVHEIHLEDGSVMTLNTDSAVNVMFSSEQRVVELVRGELLIKTAQEHGLPYRPLSVISSHGAARALGTYFNVRDHGAYTKVVVLEGAVAVSAQLDLKATSRVKSGQSVTFDAQAVGQLKQEEPDMSWARGMLVVYSMPLAQFIAELGRYHRGILRCDPEVAQLPISGSFLIKDVDTVLLHLTQILPVQLERLTDYWIKVMPA